MSKNQLSLGEQNELLGILKTRFEKNLNRHPGVDWNKIEDKLLSKPNKLWSLNEMEKTFGEPDVVGYDKENDEYIFYDCALESPKGRRSLCYDKEALDARKEFKPVNNVLDIANAMGVELLSEKEYRFLQTLGKFDSKTSSWIQTPMEIRKLGGALFADFRYETVFVYHNGAQSYYASRGFRGCLRV
jgi:hypothetical protein